LDLWRVCMKPGKPVALAHAANKPIVCLPGNPVSAFAVFTTLVSSLIRSMQGRAQVMPVLQYGRLCTQKTFNDSREEFLRVNAQPDASGITQLTPHAQQGSGIISSLAWASGLARIPANTPIQDGAIVPYYDFQHWLA